MTLEWELNNLRKKAEAKGLEKGMEQGLQQGVEDSIRLMLKKLTPEEIIDLGFSPDAVKKAQKK